MSKEILTEINRVREIMGFRKPLLLEQGRLITRLLSYGARSVDQWWRALKEILVDDSIYKHWKGKIPLTAVLNDMDLTSVVELVLSKTPNVTKRSQKLMGPKLRGLGLDVSDEIAGKIGKETINTVKHPAKPLVEVLEDITGETADVIKKTDDVIIKKTTKNVVTHVDTKKIFTKLGKEMTGDLAPITASLQDLISVGQKSVPVEDVQKFLKELDIPTKDVNKWVKSLKNGGDISHGPDVRQIFTAALENNNFRKDLVDSMADSPKWQKWAQGGGWTESRVASLLGVDGKSPIVKIFYDIIINKKWFRRWVGVNLKSALTSAVAKKIYWFLGIMSTGAAMVNFLFGKSYLKGDKQQEGMSPQMYQDINTNKEMVLQEGGYTDEDAKKVANLIFRAIDEGEYKENADGDFETNLEKLDGTMTTVWMGTADEFILSLYNEIPTILACSQVCYWYQKNNVSSGSLKSALEDGMRASYWIAPYIARGAGDVTAVDVFEEIATKDWCLTCQSENTQKGYKKRIKNNWPRYQPILEDTSRKIVEPYFARVKGPMDIAVLGQVLEFCDAQTKADMSSCLVNINPNDFNTAWANHYGEDPLGDPYSPNYDENKAIDMMDEWNNQWRDLIEEREDGEDGNSVWDDIMGRRTT